MIIVREIVKIRSLVQNTARVTAANGNVSSDTRCFKKVDIQPVPFYRRISGAARIRLELWSYFRPDITVNIYACQKHITE